MNFEEGIWKAYFLRNERDYSDENNETISNIKFNVPSSDIQFRGGTNYCSEMFGLYPTDTGILNMYMYMCVYL